ncbi:hypothetical protein, partial [Nocardia asiatica]|uniref:hypothetical protein n=1 Tax=Nocardia asiatica TaxID=209252 RepID=UPI002456C51D
MPPLGNFKDLDPDLSSAERDFAEAIRGLVHRIGLPCWKIAKMIYLSKSVLIGLVHGKCKLAPDGTEIKALWALRELAVAQGGTEGVITWEELNRRRLAISTLPHQPAGSCSSCGTACLACNAAAPENQAIRMPKPARTPIVDTLAVVAGPPQKGGPPTTEKEDGGWVAAKKHN